MPGRKVAASNLVSLWEQATFKLRVLDRNQVAIHDEWRREGERFAEWVNRKLVRRPPNPATDVFYGCKSVCLETLQILSKQGVFSVVDQADPAAVEEDLVNDEREKWPGWERFTGKVPQSYYDRCAAEWSTADLVLVYSDWTKEAIVLQGVPAENVIVVPLAFEPSETTATDPAARDKNARFRVLYFGTLTLRKGIQYLAEAARLLKDSPIDFVVAGPLNITNEALDSFPPNMKYVGRVFRGNAAAAYRSADLFVLPTISDSFAITQVEAMHHGLPVIATPRCGAVVTDGIDGLLVKPGDSFALANTIAKLAEDRSLLASMSVAARIKAATFTLDHYAKQVDAEVLRRRPALTAGASR